MTRLEVRSPFNAPVFFEETVSSTMDVSRQLAAGGEPHGTVITADFQTAGRGRGQNRLWEMDRGLNLSFTIILRYSGLEKIPPALTLRAGLAVSLAIEDFAPSLCGKVLVKWPNDVMLGCKKAVGIICEADGGNAHLGIGVNVAQKEFPAHLKEKATSIASAAGMDITHIDRFLLLEKILLRLYDELETAAGEDWKPRLENRLYKKNENVLFLDGEADSGKEIKGQLAGIGENGELLVKPEGETKMRQLVTGEIIFS